MKFLPAYFRLKPLLYTFAILCIAAIAVNQYINLRPKTVNNPWIVVDIISGDRFIAERKGQELEVKLCGISAKSNESQKYLRSLINQGNGSVVLDRVSKQNNLIVAEAFVQIKPDHQEIHLNTEMILKGKAILADYKACPNAEYLEIAAEIGK